MDSSLISAIALDLGTTSIKAALLDQDGELHHISALPAPAIDSHAGYYESDAMEYANRAEEVLQQCAAHLPREVLINSTNEMKCETHGTQQPRHINLIGEGVSTAQRSNSLVQSINQRFPNKPPLGMCSQRSSFLLWDNISGQPVTPLISWQDNRGSRCCELLHAAADDIQMLTGLRLTAYYFAPKLSVLLQDHPEWRLLLSEGKWLAGTLDTFLIWRWTHGQHFITDASMAARTLLMDIRQRQWSDQLCQLFDIPLAALPQITPTTALNIPMDNGFTLQSSVGDQSAALIACVADNSDEALINLGTGGFVIRTLAPETTALKGYLHTFVCQEENRPARFAIEGTLNSITAALAAYPVRNCHVDDLARNDIFCIAEPSGLGAPYFRTEWGIHFSESTTALTAEQTAALMLEAIIFRVARILEDFHQDAPLSRAYLSGGLSELSCLQYGIAQCAPCPILHMTQKETSLQGAALLAIQHRIKSSRYGDTIPIANRNNALLRKYQHWKNWLDTILSIGTQHN